jgi:Carboxypeptidase regulatory-like domain
MQKVLVTAIAFSLACFGTAQTEKHAVRGIVLDTSKSPLAGALVSAMPLDDNSAAGNLLWAKSDPNGRFTLLLKPGKYSVIAKDESRAYPDPVFSFSSDPRNTFPDVAVENTDVAGVQVILAPKGGVLEGEVVDEATRNTIADAAVTLRDAQNPQAFVELKADKSGRFHAVVPNKPITVIARSHGYRSTQFQSGNPILLSEGNRRSIIIELSRDAVTRK